MPPGEAFFEAGLSLTLNDRLSSEMGKAAAATEAASERISSSAEKMEERFTSMGDRLSTTGRQAVEAGQRVAFAGGVMLAPLAAAVFQSGRMEEKMIDVSKTTGLAGEALNEFEQELQQIDTRTQTAQLAELAAAGGRMGVQKDQLVAFAEQADRVSVAFDGINAQEAGRTLGELSNIYDRQITELGTVTDKINALSENLGAGASEILNFTRRSGQMASTMGLTAGQTAALGGSLIEMGLAPERAATGFNRLLSRLNNAETLSKDALSAFEDLGINAKDLGELMREDAQAGILKFLRSVKDSENPVLALTQILGQEAGPKMAQLAQQSETLAGRLEKVKDESFFAGSVMGEFSKRQDTLAGQAQRTRKNLGDIADTIGDQLRPMLTGIMDTVRRFTARLERWANRNEALASTIVTTTAALGALLVAGGGAIATFGFLAQGVGASLSAIGTLIGVIPTIVGALGTLATGLATATAAAWAYVPSMGAVTTAIRAVTAAIASNPIGALVTGLVVGATLLIRHWGPVKNFFLDLWETVSPIIDRITGFIEGIGTAIGLSAGGQGRGMSSAIPQGTRGGSVTPAAAGGAAQAGAGGGGLNMGGINQEIVIQGNADQEDVERATKNANRDLERRLKRIKEEENRTNF